MSTQGRYAHRTETFDMDRLGHAEIADAYADVKRVVEFDGKAISSDGGAGIGNQLANVDNQAEIRINGQAKVEVDFTFQGNIRIAKINGKRFARRHGKGEGERQNRIDIVVGNVEAGIVCPSIAVQRQRGFQELFQILHVGCVRNRSQSI